MPTIKETLVARYGATDITAQEIAAGNKKKSNRQYKRRSISAGPAAAAYRHFTNKLNDEEESKRLSGPVKVIMKDGKYL